MSELLQSRPVHRHLGYNEIAGRYCTNDKLNTGLPSKFISKAYLQAQIPKQSHKTCGVDIFHSLLA